MIKFGPTFIYNVPTRTGQDIPFHIIDQLAKHKHFAGVKECHSVQRVKEYVDGGIKVWTGNDDEAFKCIYDHKANGAISVISNIIPDILKDRKNKRKNEILFRWLFQEPNPIGVNTALAMMGIVEPVFRMPYLPLCEEERRKGERILKDHFDINCITLEDSDFKILDHY